MLIDVSWCCTCDGPEIVFLASTDNHKHTHTLISQGLCAKLFLLPAVGLKWGWKAGCSQKATIHVKASLNSALIMAQGLKVDLSVITWPTLSIESASAQTSAYAAFIVPGSLRKTACSYTFK